MSHKKQPQPNPVTIPAHLPFLSAICWQTEDVRKFSLTEMLDRYERGWRYRGVIEKLENEELIFVSRLANIYGSWIVNDV